MEMNSIYLIPVLGYYLAGPIMILVSLLTAAICKNRVFLVAYALFIVSATGPYKGALDAMFYNLHQYGTFERFCAFLLIFGFIVFFIGIYDSTAKKRIKKS